VRKVGNKIERLVKCSPKYVVTFMTEFTRSFRTEILTVQLATACLADSHKC